MPRPFEFDGTWPLPCTPEELWGVLEQTERYPQWWPWLQSFEAEGLRQGTRARFTVRPPLPYRLHVTVDVEDVQPGRSVDAIIGGDLSGPASLAVTPAAGGGCEARLEWSLHVRRPLLAVTERLARPLMRWGHDQVVAAGLRQFTERALEVGDRRRPG